MTAPKQMWVNECDYTQCTNQPAITGLRYTRADAPELLALVATLKAVLEWDKSRGFIVPYRVRDPMHNALAQWEALQ